MYSDVLTALFNSGTGMLDVFADNIPTAFTSALDIAVPIVGGIAIGYFAIRVVRSLLDHQLIMRTGVHSILNESRY